MRWKRFPGAGERETVICENEFTLYSVSHKASQMNILSKKLPSAKLSLEIVFCQQAKHYYATLLQGDLNDASHLLNRENRMQQKRGKNLHKSLNLCKPKQQPLLNGHAAFKWGLVTRSGHP